MAIRYRVRDLPTIGASAFTPTATMPPPASSWGLVHVFGSPGTLPIPVRNPLEAIPPISAVPKTQSSKCSPDVIFPDIYIPSTKNMGPQCDAGINMALRRRNPLPVPAINTVRVPVSVARRRHVGGRKETTRWPRVFQRFTSTQGGA